MWSKAPKNHNVQREYFPVTGVRKRGCILAFLAATGRMSFGLELRDFHTVVLDISSDILISEGSHLRSRERERRMRTESR